MSEDTLVLRFQLTEAQKDLAAAQARVAELEASLSEKPQSTISPDHKSDYQAFDSLLESYQVIGFDWRYLYLNNVAAQFGRQAKENLLGYTVMEKYPGIEGTELFAVMQKCMVERIAEDGEFEFRYPDGSAAWFDFRIQPVPEGISILTLAMTQRKKAAEQINKLYRTLAVLSNINQAIVRTRDIPTLFKQACTIAVEQGTFRMAWIGLLIPETQAVQPVAYAGVTDNYLEKLNIVLVDEPRGYGPTGNTLRSGERVICNDIENDPQMLPWRADALHLGFRASVALPLAVAGQVRGVFNLYADKAGFFDTEELKLVDEMALDIAFAMTVAEQEAQRQQAEIGLKHYAERMKILHEIDLGLIRGGSIQALVETALKNLRQIIPCQRVDVSIMDETTGEALVFAIGIDGDTSLGQGVRVPIPPNVFEGYDARHMRLFDDIRVFQDVRPRARQLVNEGLVCALSVLLMDQERPIGVLGLFASVPNFFTAEHQEVAAEVANQLAIALHQMRLSEALAYHTANLERAVVERTAELIHSKSRVEAILNNSMEGILLAYLNVGIQQSNAMFNTLFGCVADDYFAQPLTALVHIDDTIRVAKTVQAVIAEQQGKNIEVCARRKDNSLFDAELGIGYIHTKDRDDQAFVCTIRDITARKQAEQTLAEERNRLRTLIDTVPDYIYIKDLQHRFVLTNKALVAAHNYQTLEEIIGKTDFDHFPAEIADGFYANEEAIFRTGKAALDHEESLMGYEGGVEWASSNKVPLRNLKGELVGLVGITRDITERKEREQTLQKVYDEELEFQKYLQILYEISIELTMIDEPDEFYKQIVQMGLIRLDFDRMGLFLYDPARNMALGKYGTDVEGHIRSEQHLQFVLEPKGGMWKSMQAPSRFYLEEQKDLVHDLSVVGNGWNASVALWHGNQNLGWLVADNLIHHKPVSRTQLEIMAQYGVYIAASLARKRAEEAARQAFAKEAELVELKSRFVSMASHEFRTPLATLLAITETLSAYRHKMSDDQIDDRVKKMQLQIGHLTHIIDDVLQLARIQARRIEFNPLKVDIDAFLQSILDEFRSRPDITHMLVYTCNTPFREAKLDKKLMHQIINNLVSNAIKYSAASKPIAISVDCVGESLIVKVSDQGIGIPQDDLKHLFEPFHRATNVGTISGTGLGLVITKEFVELHGGTISVESIVDHGTMFMITLPHVFEGEI